MKMLMSRQSYHIYSVGIEYSRLYSHQDHNGSLDNHHTLSRVEGIALMDTKVHCILVPQQDPLSPLEQYELVYNYCKLCSNNKCHKYLGYTCIHKEKVMWGPDIFQTFKQNNAARKN